MDDRDQPNDRVVLQRLRNRAIEAVETLADGDEGVRASGSAEYVNQFFDTIDDDAPSCWREWSTLTSAEVAALDRVQLLLRDACAATPQICSDDEFIASGWPGRIKPVATTALELMRARGRYREDCAEDSPSITG